MCFSFVCHLFCFILSHCLWIKMSVNFISKRDDTCENKNWFPSFLVPKTSFFFFFFRFLRLHSQHMGVPSLAVELELQLLTYATATVLLDLSHVCDLHHSSCNAGSLTPCTRPGIEPASSWILVRFVNQ